MPVIQIAANAVVAKLIGAPREAMLETQRVLSYFVEGAEHSGAYKSGQWDGMSTFFSFQQATFPAGFLYLVYSHLRRLKYEVQLIRNPFPEPLGVAEPAIDPFGFGDQRYDYQPQTVAQLLKHGQIIAQVATGGGKSRICNLAVARIKRKALFITTRGVLMYQMKDAFDAAIKSRFMAGETDLATAKVGIVGDGEYSPQPLINVAMVQTLAARLKSDSLRAETIAWLGTFEFVIIEEAHEAGGDSFYEILKHCRKAVYRLSLTATPFMRQDAESNMRLMACSGPVAIKISEQMLIDRGILARPYFKVVEPGYTPDKERFFELEKTERVSLILGRNTGYQRANKLGIIYNLDRNTRIVFECVRAAAYGLTSMVLVKNRNHGKILQDMLTKHKIASAYIFGDSNKKERTKQLKRLGKGEIQVLIGSTILDVGVDVPSVGCVVLAGGGKAEVALRQRIGRGLRAKKSGPNVALVVDFNDTNNSHLHGHSLQRFSIIKSTPGFAEQFLPTGYDFDMEGLGFKRKGS